MSTPIRILHVVTTMNLGGLENFLMNLYRNIDREKIQFDFLMHRPEESAFEQEILELGGNIYRLGTISPRHFFQYRQELTNFFSAHSEYKIVHSHLNEISSLILSIAKKAGVPVRIAHSHIAGSTENYRLIRNIIKRNVHNLATHKFACSLEAGHYLYGRKQFNLFNNSIDTKKFQYNEEQRTAIRELLNIGEGEIVLGNVSRFNVQKNHQFIIKVFASLEKVHSSVRLLLVGDGDLKDKLEKQIEMVGLTKKVIFTGAVPSPQDYLNAMDFYVFPSLFEGLPLALVEAQSNGLPILMSDTISSDIILTDLIQRLPLPESAQTWARKLIEMIDEYKNNNRKQYREIIKKAGYDIESNAEYAQNFYMEVSEIN